MSPCRCLIVSPRRQNGGSLAKDLGRAFLASNSMSESAPTRTDVVLCCRGHRFNLDSVILASRSAYFETLLSLDSAVFRDKSDENELMLNQFKPNILGLVLQYLYSDAADFGYLNEEEVEEVLELLDATTMLLLKGKGARESIHHRSCW